MVKYVIALWAGPDHPENFQSAEELLGGWHSDLEWDRDEISSGDFMARVPNVR
jgi:hypothetical protein